MNNLKIENHLLQSVSQLPSNLADDLLLNAPLGKAAVVCETPHALLRSVRDELAKYDNKSGNMLTLSTQLGDWLVADVTFATIDEFMQAPPICSAVYISCVLEKHQQHMVTSWMPPRSLVIIYS